MLVYQAGYPLWLDPMVGWPHQATLCSGHIWWAFAVGFEGRAESDLKYWKAVGLYFCMRHTKRVFQEIPEKVVSEMASSMSQQFLAQIAIWRFASIGFVSANLRHPLCQFWIHCASHCFNRHRLSPPPIYHENDHFKEDHLQFCDHENDHFPIKTKSQRHQLHRQRLAISVPGSPAATRYPAAARFQARAAAMAFCDEEGAAEQNYHPRTVGEFQCHKPFPIIPIITRWRPQDS